MRILHKAAECIGCGVCAEVASNYFEMDEEGMARLLACHAEEYFIAPRRIPPMSSHSSGPRRNVRLILSALVSLYNHKNPSRGSKNRRRWRSLLAAQQRKNLSSARRMPCPSGSILGCAELAGRLRGGIAGSNSWWALDPTARRAYARSARVPGNRVNSVGTPVGNDGSFKKTISGLSSPAHQPVQTGNWKSGSES